MEAKSRFGLVGTLSCMSLGFFVWACGSSDTNSNFEEPKQDIGAGSTNPSGTIGGSSGDPGAASSTSSSGSAGACSAKAPAGFTPLFIQPLQVNVCSDAEIDGYWDACFTSPYDDAKCKGYQSAHASCTSCLSTPDTAASLGPIILHREATYYTLNVAGCIGISENQLGSDSCAAGFAGALECKELSCDSCFAGTPNDYANFNTCKKNNNVTACGTLADSANAKCGELSAGPAAGCFGTSSETNFQIYKRMAPKFCRAGAASGGGDGGP